MSSPMPLLNLPDHASLYLWEDDAEDADLTSLGAGIPLRQIIATPSRPAPASRNPRASDSRTP